MRPFNRLKACLARFRDDCSGSFTVEAVPLVPLLFMVMGGGYEYYEVHRYTAVREKATYTVADMISRETSNEGVTATYMDNALQLVNMITNDEGVDQLRVSVVKYDSDDDDFSISWSEVRGTGSWNALTDTDVQYAHDRLPIMDDGQEVIVVETRSTYDPVFAAGLGSPTDITTRHFTAIRFAPQVCFEGECG
ncbi:TadE/TadG family type IV pilus assembly protein [Roseovarius sp. SYSU LYC5161]|uniref:TadE/TadG family type IV pilus assembly protein n=1 Tax=Roseovarius halophilus (ex Wu et al. 2025) TaxID=3376060 RepID=UPI0039994E99